MGTLEERFWAKVARGPGCWEWQAARDSDGYGAIKVGGRRERAHRASWFIEKGAWPTGELVHACGNRGCVCPDHLQEEAREAGARRRPGPWGSGHVQKRGKGWRIFVTAGRDPVTGRVRQISRTVHVATEREARAEVARLLFEVSQGEHQARGDHTFGELLDAWLGHATPNLEPGTAALYAYMIGYVTPALRAKPVRKLTAEDLDALYRWLLKHGATDKGRREGLKGGPLSPKSVREVHNVIRLALAQGKRWRWVDANVALDATPPTHRKPSAVSPAPADVIRLLHLSQEKDPAFALLVRLAAVAGPRRGEMAGIRWNAIDLERATLQVRRRIVWNRAERRWEERDSTKTARNRVVALGVRTVELLREHRARMVERACAAGVELPHDAFVFSDEPGGSVAWRPARVTRRFGVLRRRAGLPPSVRLHDLRVFLSTELQEAGHPLPVVAGRLGHSQFSTTLDHYTGWMPAADRHAANYLETVIDGQDEAHVAQPQDASAPVRVEKPDHPDRDAQKRR